MRLVVLDGEIAVCRLDPAAPVPDWAAEGSISSATRTPDELSIVCAAAAVPANVQAERAWRALRVAGRLDFSLTGVLASLANPLAAAKISLFAISTFDTDYVLVREHSLADAIESLRSAGHDIIAA